MSWVLAVVLLLSITLKAQQPVSAPPTAKPAPVQPLPYSHKKHVALGLDCRTCHVNPAPGKLMTFPPTAFCMGCHQAIAADRPSIRQLANFAASGQPVPWVRVYKLPDYVFWKHATHLRPDITCADCHGPVAERDVIALETNVVTMVGCISCHDKRQVYTDCGDCHLPRH